MKWVVDIENMDCFKVVNKIIYVELFGIINESWEMNFRFEYFNYSLVWKKNMYSNIGNGWFKL